MVNWLRPGTLSLKFGLEVMFLSLLDLLSISFLFLLSSALKGNRAEDIGLLNEVNEGEKLRSESPRASLLFNSG